MKKIMLYNVFRKIIQPNMSRKRSNNKIMIVWQNFKLEIWRLRKGQEETWCRKSRGTQWKENGGVMPTSQSAFKGTSSTEH